MFRKPSSDNPKNNICAHLSSPPRRVTNYAPAFSLLDHLLHGVFITAEHTAEFDGEDICCPNHSWTVADIKKE
jgi:hypothetical protein